MDLFFITVDNTSSLYDGQENDAMPSLISSTFYRIHRVRATLTDPMRPLACVLSATKAKTQIRHIEISSYSISDCHRKTSSLALVLSRLLHRSLAWTHHLRAARSDAQFDSMCETSSHLLSSTKDVQLRCLDGKCNLSLLLSLDLSHFHSHLRATQS